jgi:hypothetical protein
VDGISSSKGEDEMLHVLFAALLSAPTAVPIAPIRQVADTSLTYLLQGMVILAAYHSATQGKNKVEPRPESAAH